jgi:hypothetical protein
LFKKGFLRLQEVRMSPEIEIAAKVAFFDCPFLVVGIVTTAVVGTPLVLAYLGVLHYRSVLFGKRLVAAMT